MIIEKSLFDFMEEKKEFTWGDGWKLQMDGNKLWLEIDDEGRYLIEDEYQVMDLLEKKLEKQIRICQVCGSPMDSGYTVEGGGFYACSDECFKNDCDARYGKGKWKETDKLTELQRRDMAKEEFGEDSYHAWLGADGLWHSDDTFYTEWY